MWEVLLILRAADHSMTSEELADSLNTSKQKIYEAIYRLNQVFNGNIIRGRDKNTKKVIYMWHDTLESVEFFSNLESEKSIE
jgi:transcription initiation factor IIE alpha subunit